MQRRTRTRGARTGGVLIATLVMVMTIGAISICLLELDSSRLKRQVASIDNKRAFNLAEAGLSEAYFSIATGESGNVGSREAPAKFGDGLFWVEATEVQPNVIGLESTGMAGSGRVTLSLVVKRKPATIGALGVMSSQDVSIGSGALLDAFDSSSEADLETHSMPLRSNGNISVGAATKIVGDATPGPDGSVTLGLLASVSGSTAPGASTVALPEIEVPAIDYGPDIVNERTSPLDVTGPATATGTLRVGSGSTIRLVGPATIVVDQLIVDPLGTLEIDSSAGPVELYVTDWLNVQSTSRLTFPQTDTKGFTLSISASGVRDRDGDGVNDPAVRFLPSGDFYGSLYAPGARIALPVSYRLYGAVSADKLILGASSQVHFDVALMESDPSSLGTVEMLSWRIVDIPVEVARDLASDPFDILAVDPAALESPAQAHEDIDYMIHVKYLDLSLTECSYRGSESGFDWGQVRVVIALVRTAI
ncbi:MAG: hypothetical protein IT454_19065 [Planctomycetes bacterium]|nr:hypothetical protein [Planctomycetota bacterium]